MNPVFGLNYEWLPQDPDGSKCSACEQDIYSTKWVEHIVVGDSKAPTDEGPMCQNCYDIYRKEKDFQDNFGHLF